MNRNSSRTPPEAVKRYLDEAIRVIRARAMLLLTTDVFADRIGKAYGDRINPDVAVVDPEGATSEASVTLREAVSWLRAQPGCSRG